MTEDKLLGSIEEWLATNLDIFEDKRAWYDTRLLIHLVKGQHLMALELTRLNAGVERLLAEVAADKAKIAADATKLAADEKAAQDAINSLADKLDAAVPPPAPVPPPAA